MDKSNNVVAPLGNYITLCRKKNTNLESTKLVGVSSKKELLFTNLQLRYEDSTQYFVLKSGQFIVDLVSVTRINKLPVALNETSKIFLVSSVYQVFEINSPNLMEKYLMLFFRSDVVDRQSVFWAGSGVRGFLTWSNFCKISITVPPLDKQERIVNKYQTISKYIELKKKINELFEKQMIAYYHALFDNLTDYTIKNFGELFTIVRGGRPPRGNKEQEQKYFCKENGIPWLQVRDIAKKGLKFVDKATEQLTPEGFKRANCYMISPRDLIFVHNASTSQLGSVYVNSSELTMNTNFWGISNKLTSSGGGNKIAYL